MITGGVNDAEATFTSVTARRFASPSCRQLKALSSRFSAAGCPASEGIWLSGERVITRVDSFNQQVHQVLTDAPPMPPGFIAVFCQNGSFLFSGTSSGRTMVRLDRKTGRRRDATRAPTQARNGWRPSGRLLDKPVSPSKDARNFVQTMGSTSRRRSAKVTSTKAIAPIKSLMTSRLELRSSGKAVTGPASRSREPDRKTRIDRSSTPIVSSPTGCFQASQHPIETERPPTNV